MFSPRKAAVIKRGVADATALANALEVVRGERISQAEQEYRELIHAANEARRQRVSQADSSFKETADLAEQIRRKSMAELLASEANLSVAEAITRLGFN